MSESILTKTIASTGQRVEVRCNPRYLAQLLVILDGEEAGTGNLLRLQQPKMGCTHFIMAGGKGFGFTAEEARTIEAAVKAARDAETQRLRDERRQRLASDPEYAAWQHILDLEDRLERAERAIDSPNYSDTGVEYADAAEARAELEKARQAYLATFGEQGAGWAERAKLNNEERERRRRDYENSFVARGLD